MRMMVKKMVMLLLVDERGPGARLSSTRSMIASSLLENVIILESISEKSQKIA